MTTSRRSLPWLLLSLTALSASLPAGAVQTLAVKDGVAIEAIIAAKDPTRIRIDGAQITDVVGNIYSSNCGSPAAGGVGASPAGGPQVNPGGELILQCDREKGEIFVRPVATGAKPITLFVSSPAATYTLLLRRSDIPAETIVLRDSTPSQGTPSAALMAQYRATSHERALKGMYSAMVLDRPNGDIRSEEVKRTVGLWAQAQFTLLKLFEGRGLRGEVYELVNISSEPMVLSEQEFDRGPPGEVLAISVSNHNLLPGERTRVYVVLKGN